MRADDLVAIILPLAAFSIPIIAIMAKHQQRMATLIHGAGGGADARLSQRMDEVESQVASSRAEIQEIKQLLIQQTLAIDSMKGLPLGGPPDAPG